MKELRANTQVKVVIGPVVAVGDGFTPVTTLDLSTADEAEIMKHDAAAVTSISAATFAAITSADGYYNLTITTSLSDTEGLLTVLINDDSLCLPVKAEFMVLSEAAWDSKYVAKDDGFMDVNIKTIGRADTQETEATNLEAACAAYSATRGLAGTALPAAAADAAGGLPISDAGGLDLDAKLANTNEVTAARMGALTDWIDGGRLDLIIDAILVDTGTTLQGELDGIQADTEDIQSRLPAALGANGNIKADVRDLLGTAWLTPGTAGTPDVNTKLAGGTAWGSGAITGGSIASGALSFLKFEKALLDVLNYGTVGSSASTTMTPTVAQGSVTNHHIGCLLWIYNGTGVHQVRVITAWDDTSFTVDRAWTTNPDAGDLWKITPAVPWLQPTTVGRFLDVSAAGEAGIDWANIGSPTTTVNLSGTTVKTATDIATAIAALNNITAASVVTAMGTGTFLSAIPWNASWDAEVQSEVDDALTAFSVSTLTAAGVRTAVGLGSANLDTQLAAIQADLPTKLTRNAAFTNFMFKMVDSTDHVTAETGVTITATRSLDGAAFGACANSASEVASGWYKIDLAAGDLNGNCVVLRFTGTGCDVTEIEIITQPT